MLTAPVLSEWDPLEQGEGSIDPLGLAPAYERLADQVFKNVTVRTLIAIPEPARSQPALDLVHEHVRGPAYYE